ncbi:ABC transporter ATP-binding protein [Paractinoplanes rishiriensis]|uniref:Multidrug ABC transporter permease n=1 Tax=Paractinoplanes rishiriensis TaxID=1050105 RepID=A0A919K5F2_9ACTN|nr:ATP-binding cassette domain-containing protein [Actinoplanes rishiriensis]GIE99647.1 multidrug ABC transporter permease [Actinoplanes rishiriensis]
MLSAQRLRLVRLLVSAGPVALAGLLVTGAVVAGAAPAAAVATGWFVSRVVDGGAVLPPLVVLAAVVFVRQVGIPAGEVARSWVAKDIDGGVRSAVRQVMLAPRGIEHLTDPDVVDDATRASDRGEVWRVRSAGLAAVGQFTFLVRLVGAAGSAVVLASYFPAVAVLLLAATLVMRVILRRQWVDLARCGDEFVPVQRQTRYWTQLITGPDAAKEIRLFGLGSWVAERRRSSYLSWGLPLRKRSWSVLRRQWPGIGLAAGSAAVALAVPGLAATQGLITAQDVATCLVAAWSIFAVGVVGQEAFDIEFGISAIRATDRLTHRFQAQARAGAVSAGPGHIRFERVTFAYPGRPEPVLDGLDLDIRSGEVLAVVGVNGAGKTTFTKLLAGLYRPVAGRITVDGADLDGVDVEAWRRHVAVVFQDFVHYPATLRDNIRLAAPEAPAGDEQILAAIERAGAQSLLAGLPDGLDTPLWRSDAGGTDLSGGQWQRVAISRAMYAVAHGRRVLVLDEPTAHLDVTAEAAFYDRVVTAASAATIILISHRLSTIRAADRIIVLSGGTVAESGTHDELMAADGEYARLFRLQASRFAEMK